MLSRTEFSLIGDIFRRSGLYGDKKAQIQLSLSFFCLILAQGTVVAVPLIFGLIVDALESPTDLDKIGDFDYSIIIYLLAAFTLTRFTNRFAANAKDFLFDWATFGLLVRLYNNAFSHLLSLPYSFFVDGSTGSVSKAWDRGAWASQSVIDALIYRFIPMFLTAFFTLSYISWTYGWLLSGLVSACMITYILWVQWSVQQVRKHMSQSNKFEDNLNRIAVDSFTNALSVKVFNGYGSSEARIKNDFLGYRDENRSVSLSSLVLGSGGALIVSITLASVMFVAFRHYHQGLISTGQFVALFTLVNQVFIPVSGIGRAYRDIKASLIKWDTLRNMLNQPTEFDVDGAQTIDLSQKQIEFKNLDFSYAEKPMLKGLNFVVQPGKSLAIVGPSGSGKSTLVKILLRLWLPNSGGLLVDGQPVEEFQLKSWRSNFGVVTQDPSLLNDSIKNNILFGRVFASDALAEEAMKKAAEAAELDGFIAGLDKGYDTLIGERGVKLSGGEAQRLAIARALADDPTVLVFDEATSSLDTVVEREIQSNLMRVSKGRTSVTIAHRLTTIIDADTILVMDKGRLVQSGTHKQLLEQTGLYADLWNAQLKAD
ncbi:MAG: ABC transporter ATP-binding protein [Alphaproteobacteria bacterium]